MASPDQSMYALAQQLHCGSLTSETLVTDLIVAWLDPRTAEGSAR